VAFDGSTFTLDMSLLTGKGSDAVDYRDTTISRQATFDLDRGDDAVRFDAASSIPSNLAFRGGSGNDSVNASSSSSTGVTRTVIGVESQTTSDSWMSRLFTGTDSLISRRLSAIKTLLGPAIQAITLTSSADATKSVVSANSSLITKQAAIAISGQTLSGAKIELSRDADGLFNDGTTTAATDGTYSVTANLLHNASNNGANVIKVRATGSSGQQATNTLNLHLAIGTVTRFTSSLGTFDVELLDDEAPNTVANFLNYSARYVDSVVHRSFRTQSGGDFIVQGGGFKFTGGTISPISVDSPIDSERISSNSNIRGTLAMALPSGNPDGATSQWFVNLSDQNSFLDAQGFTVFGRVIGEGLAVADAIHDLTNFNLASLVGQSVLTDVPLRSYANFTVSLSGVVAGTAGSDTITGTGTTFTTELPADKRIKIGTQEFTVLQVVSNTQLTLTSPIGTTFNNATADVNLVPLKSNYVSFTSIATLPLP
jgi:cyclophilin family peptidyl-prolyl cis-trans isomerase